MPAGTPTFEVRALRSAAELRACVELQRATWGADFADVVPPSLLLAAQRVGGVAAGAFSRTGAGAGAGSGEEMIGFVFGLSGLEDGRLVHWSDMLAVRPDVRDRGVGRALKLWQREAVLALGCRRMRWTFDPLESRNARLNFAHLGVLCDEYATDMYADTGSDLHAGIGTDRMVVRWELDSPRVRARLDGSGRPPVCDEVDRLPLVNPVACGGSACAAPRLDLTARRVRVAVPADVQRLKRERPDAALGWRAATRAAFTSYFARGYVATELVRCGEWSAYVLEAGADASGGSVSTAEEPRPLPR